MGPHAELLLLGLPREEVSQIHKKGEKGMLRPGRGSRGMRVAFEGRQGRVLSWGRWPRRAALIRKLSGILSNKEEPDLGKDDSRRVKTTHEDNEERRGWARSRNRRRAAWELRAMGTHGVMLLIAAAAA